MDFTCAKTQANMEIPWRDRKVINGYKILHGNDSDIDLEDSLVFEEINGAYFNEGDLKISLTLKSD